MKYISLGAEKKMEYFLPGQYFNRGQVIEGLREIINRILDEDFKARPKDYMTCHYCDYKPVCPRYYGNYD